MPRGLNSDTPLTRMQLDDTANVPGIFIYSPAAGTILGAGVDTISVIFTPTDTNDYTPATTTTTITVAKATPSVSVTGPVPTMDRLFLRQRQSLA